MDYNVKTIWEHDFRKLRETDEMKHFLDTFDIVTDLEPRDAFFGGRVNGFKLFRGGKEDETIEYVVYRQGHRIRFYKLRRFGILRKRLVICLVNM